MDGLSRRRVASASRDFPLSRAYADRYPRDDFAPCDALALLPAPARTAVPAFASLIFPHPRRVQERMSSAVTVTSLASLLEDASSDADRACLRSTGGPGAGAWLMSPPIVASLQFALDLFLIAIRTRLSLP